MIKRLIGPLHVLISLISQVLGGLILGIALMPVFLFLWVIWMQLVAPFDSWLDALVLCLALGLSVYIFGNSILVVIVIFRNLFFLRNKEASGDYFSKAVLGIAAYDFLVGIAHHTFLNFTRATPFLVWFYRGMGAKIGKGTLITTARIYDCDLIEIGKNCVIGGQVAINAHTAEGRKGILKKVRIGNRVTLGANTMVLPGVVIEDNVTVGANSLIPKDAVLEANSIYGGVPVKKISDLET
jgi:acetyltransferase-like isoleucine patch superfamily enzyme